MIHARVFEQQNICSIEDVKTWKTTNDRERSFISRSKENIEKSARLLETQCLNDN